MKKLVMQVLLATSMVLALSAAAIAGSSSFAANTYTPSGTSISNSASCTYKDSNNTVQTPVTSNTVTTTVTQIYGVVITPATDAKIGTDGQTVYYTVTVNNNGNGDDTFNLISTKTGGTWTSASAVTFYSDAGQTIPITVTGTIHQNQSQVVYMSVTVPAGQVDLSTNTTTATATSVGDNTKSDTDACTTTVNSDVFTASTKTSSTANPQIGVPFTYTITVKNTGTIAATANEVITDVIGSGATANLTYVPGTITVGGSAVADSAVEGSTTAWNSGTKTITISYPALAAGASVVITFQATVNSGATGTITNTATITYDNGSYSPANAVTPASGPTLGLVKTVDKATAAPGAVLTYDITATNSGGSPATNVAISDVVPNHTTYLGNIKTGPTGSLSNGGGSYNSGTSTVSSNAVTIQPGQTWVLEFQVTVQ